MYLDDNHQFGKSNDSFVAQKVDDTSIQGNYLGADYYRAGGKHEGVFIPKYGETFMLAEWRPYKSSGTADKSYTRSLYVGDNRPVFRCLNVRRAADGSTIVDAKVYDKGSTSLKDSGACEFYLANVRLEPVAEVAVEVTMTVVEVVGPDLSALLNAAIREANVRGMNRTDLEDQHIALLSEAERATEALTLGAAELDRRAQENDTLKAQIRGLEAKVRTLREDASRANNERDRFRSKIREIQAVASR